MWLLANSSIVRIVPEEAASRRRSSRRARCSSSRRRRRSCTSESDLAKVFAQGEAAVERSRKLFDLLDDVALDENQSRRKLTEYRGPTPLRTFARTQ